VCGELRVDRDEPKIGRDGRRAEAELSCCVSEFNQEKDQRFARGFAQRLLVCLRPVAEGTTKSQDNRAPRPVRTTLAPTFPLRVYQDLSEIR
jgi:hypothetical protein